jgi:hypothetical protein
MEATLLRIVARARHLAAAITDKNIIDSFNPEWRNLYPGGLTWIL